MKSRYHYYGIILGLLSLFSTFFLISCGPNTETKTETINLKSGEHLSIPVNLEIEELIEGTFSVQGPTNLDIKFSIQDPFGVTVYGPVQSRSQSFIYRAQDDGTHFIYIDNTYSLFNEKTLLLTYTYPKQ